MKKLLLAFSFVFLINFSTPYVALALAPGELIVCQGTKNDPCDFPKLLELFQKGIKALVEVATLVTVVAFIYLGFMFITSQGNPAVRSELRKRASAILIGYFFIIAAWIIVYTIMNVLVDKSYIFLK